MFGGVLQLLCIDISQYGMLDGRQSESTLRRRLNEINAARGKLAAN